MDGPLVQGAAYALSTVTILSCLFLKIPQIMYVREKHSAEGIYIQAMLMEIMGFSIVTLYNYTNHYGLMTYLEYPIILLQLYVLLFYVLKFKRVLQLPAIQLGTLAYITAVVLFFSEMLPKYLLSYMLPFCTPLSGFAKVTYMYGIISTANSDAVSLTTWCISIFTNLSRLFTVFVDSADIKLMINFIISSLLSMGVLVTALYYKKRDNINAPQPRRQSGQQRYDHRKLQHDD